MERGAPIDFTTHLIDMCPSLQPHPIKVTCSKNLQFGGTKAPAAMISVHSIGYGGASAKANKEALLRQIGAAMNKVAQVPADRLFMSFEDVQTDMWGFNNELFCTIFG